MGPGEGREFLVVKLGVTESQTKQVDPSYAVLVDGEPAPEAVAAAVQRVVDRVAHSVAVTVPEGAGLTLAVTTGDTTQNVSLRTGTVDDGGRGARLAERVDATATGTLGRPSVTTPGVARTHEIMVSRPYQRSASWTLSPWTATEGWAPDGETFLTLTLTPSVSTNALPLTAADATIDVDGSVLDAVAFDASSYRYTFVIPEDPDRFTAQVRATVDTATLDRASSWSWPAGSTVDAPWVYGWTVDVNAERR